MTPSYWFAARPKMAEHQHPFLVFDCSDRLHFPLTVFAKDACSRLDPKTAQIYLYQLGPYFTWLDTNVWQARMEQTWDAPPRQVRRSIDDYLVQKLQCQLSLQRQGWKYVKVTARTKSTLRIFLAALKLYYQIMCERQMYPFANPLVDSMSATIAVAISHVEYGKGEQKPPRMPDQSGVEALRKKPKYRLTDSFYKLEHQETEAIVPQFTALRAEAHFRYNRMARLRQAYRQALSQVLPDRSNLPLEFSYEEGDPPTQRIVARLWDRRSFTLYPEHAEKFHYKTVKRAQRKQHASPDDQSDVFLEFVKAECVEGSAPPEGFWFADILKHNLLGHRAYYGSAQDVAQKQALLRQWGHGEEDSEDCTSPFNARHQGLLTWHSAGQRMEIFIALAQQRTNAILLPVESFYAATTFGLLALELLTTTGMRINELMQVSLSSECIIRMVDDPPPGASDQTPRIRYILRLLPKGERTEKRHHYGIGKDALQLIEQTAHLLCEHYNLQPGEPLPRVPFCPSHSRSHRFGKEKAPYVFQYHAQHFSNHSINACLRFLTHGMIFQTSDGTPVILKAHLLRHVFATFAVQVEGLPVDLVAEWLKQKNIDTTWYYSQKGQQEVTEEHASFVERLATEINIREAIVRSPEEIRKLAEQARRRVGTLVPVCGGECTFDGWCHNQFDCIRCPSKAPEPEKRYQVEEKQRWAEDRLAYYEREGLVLEAEKMRQLLRNCARELREMDQMVAYRKDAQRVIQIQPRPKRT